MANVGNVRKRNKTRAFDPNKLAQPTIREIIARPDVSDSPVLDDMVVRAKLAEIAECFAVIADIMERNELIAK